MTTTKRFAIASFVLLLAPCVAFAQSKSDDVCRQSESAEDCFRRGLALARESVGDETASGHSERVHALERRAQGILRSACSAGSGNACYFAGRMVAAPQEWPLDVTITGPGSAESVMNATLTEAVKLFRKGCYSAKPSAGACNALGDSYSYGLGETVQLDSAIKFYEKGCTLGGAEGACTRWAALLEGHYEMGPARKLLAYDLVQRGCRAGSPTGCTNVAYTKDTALYARTNSEIQTPENQRQGELIARLYREQCKNGIEIACNNVGALFANGRYGIPRGLSAAQRSDSTLYYYRLACNGIPLRISGRDTTRSLGVGYASKNLGDRELYKSPPDTAAAVAENRKGCLLLDQPACAELALQEYMIHHDSADVSLLRAVTVCNEGRGVGCNYAGWLLRQPAFDNPSESLVYFRKACDLDYAWSCQRLGDLESTLGARAKYHRRACDLNEGYGCRGLAVILENSFSQPDRALIFYVKGCDDGFAMSCWDAKRLHRERHDEVQEGMDRAKACRIDRSYCKKKDGTA
jgi:TPR repeat protein